MVNNNAETLYGEKDAQLSQDMLQYNVNLYHRDGNGTFKFIPSLHVVKCQGWSKLLSTPTGIDYVIIGFDMEVQALVTHTAA